MNPLRLILISLILLLAVSAHAQYDQREILSQQAYRALAQRQYTEAEAFFTQILQAYPDDLNSILQLLNIYFQTSRLDKAEAMLSQYRRILPANQFDEQSILLLVMQGKPDQAWDLAQSYLERQRYQENSLRLVASYLERRGFYDHVLRLYLEGRARAGNPELFRLEIANAALNYRRLDLALAEYLAFLDRNPGNIFFISNQCKTIVGEDSTLVSVIGNYAAASANPVLKELYANVLIGLKRYQEALEVYKTLTADKVIRFAEEQYLALNDEVALPAFDYLAGVSTDPVARNDYLLRQGQILFRKGEHRTAQDILERIVADSLMQDRRYLQKKNINLNTRKLLAQNTLILSKDPLAARFWLNEARKFCNNSYDLQDIDLTLVNTLLITDEHAEASRLLDGVTEPGHRERRDYLRFNLELLSGNIGYADSLMNEFVIRYPASYMVNDAIYQLMFTLSLEGAARHGFFSAYRLMMLQDPAAVDTLQAIFAANQDEELLILAVEWALMLSETEKAGELLSHAWQDSICAEYAELLRLKLKQDRESVQNLAREFLKSNPNSIFSPKFRQELSRINYSRPQF